MSASEIEYQLPDLEYGYSDLDPYYPAEALEIHHTKHHAAYVKGVNSTLASLREARAGDDYESLNQLQKNLAFHLSGHVLHSMFWKNIGPDGGGEPGQELEEGLRQAFDGVNLFREQFSHAALSVQGSGWAALSWEPVGKGLVVEQIYDHQGNSGNGTVPILVLDMWEHAFYLQHRNDKQSWVENFWQIVDWNDVQERFGTVKRLDLCL